MFAVMQFVLLGCLQACMQAGGLSVLLILDYQARERIDAQHHVSWCGMQHRSSFWDSCSTYERKQVLNATWSAPV